MRKYAGLAMILFALVIAGALSASGASRLWATGGSGRVIAHVLSVSGDTVTLYYGGPSEGKVFCDNENIPIFTNNVLEGNVSLVGEVKLTNLISPNYAVGRLVVGDANLGSLASKPSAMCLKG